MDSMRRNYCQNRDRILTSRLTQSVSGHSPASGTVSGGDPDCILSSAPADAGDGTEISGQDRAARRYEHLEFDHLKKMGVVLKRAHYFITCSGQMMYRIPIEEHFITRQLTSVEYRENWQLMNQQEYHQMSLFGDFGVQA